MTTAAKRRQSFKKDLAEILRIWEGYGCYLALTLSFREGFILINLATGTMSLEEMGAKMMLTRERIRQIGMKALRKAQAQAKRCGWL